MREVNLVVALSLSESDNELIAIDTTFIMPESSQVWRLLGLSVGVQYCLLGGFCMLQPARVAELWTLSPKRTETSAAKIKENAMAYTLVQVAENQHAVTAETSMLLLGCRDISLGIATCSLWYLDNMRGVATVILSGMFVCAVDVAAIWQMRGQRDGLVLGAGAVFWGVTGLGLWNDVH